MKKIFASILALSLIATTPDSKALFGGPFDNGYHNNLSGGTFHVVYQMKNGSGLMRFSDNPNTITADGSNSNLNAGSTYSQVFYRGIFYSSVNDNIVSNSNGVNNTPDNFGGYAFVDMQSGTAMGTSISKAIISTSEVTSDIDIETAGGEVSSDFSQPNSARNIGTCAVNWNARVTENGYNLRFKGKGVAHFYGTLDSYTDTSSFVNFTGNGANNGFAEDAPASTTNGTITITPASPGDINSNEIVTTTTTEVDLEETTTPLPTEATLSDFDIDTESGTATLLQQSITEEDPSSSTVITNNGSGFDGIVSTGGSTTTETFVTYSLDDPNFDTNSETIDLTDLDVIKTTTVTNSTSRDIDIDPGTPATRSETATTITGGTQESTFGSNTTSGTIDANTTASEGGESTDFEDVGHKVNVQVYGSRTSWFTTNVDISGAL